MEIQRHALVKRDYLVPFVLVTSLFFLWGFAHAILDVLNKHFQEVMDITRTHSAIVQGMFYLGDCIMAIPIVALWNRVLDVYSRRVLDVI